MKSCVRSRPCFILAMTTGIVLLLASPIRAQDMGPFKDTVGKFGVDTPTVYGLGNGVLDRTDPGPYQGQIYCPVTGAKLPADGSAVKVQTDFGAVTPTRTQKFFGAKAVPGMVLYVCCSECAKKVKANPQHYITEVIADHSTFSFRFVDAPSQRPERPIVKRPDSSVTQATNTTETPIPSSGAPPEASPLQR